MQDVIKQMEDLDSELRGTTLENVRAFNTTYLIITKAVASKLGSGYFKDDALMEKFDIAFAIYYFEALKQYIETNKTTPAWQILFEQSQKNNRTQIIYMALGVNAHVNNDLGLTLRDIIISEDYLPEYNKINPLIYSSIDTVVNSLNENSRPIDFIEKKLKIIYFPVLRKIISEWREDAWDDYVALKKKTTTTSKIEKDAYLIGKMINH
jgi:hypothetical protein